jgi:hypothetical protein
MPKLDKKTATRVGNAEGSSFEALPEGPYLARLREVTVRDGNKGPYWSWEFEVVGGEHDGRRLWVNTSLSENADWKMKEVFEAFGYSTDSDTDEMVGELVKLIVSQRIIERGARQGEVGNNVDTVMPAETEDMVDDDGLM